MHTGRENNNETQITLGIRLGDHDRQMTMFVMATSYNQRGREDGVGPPAAIRKGQVEEAAFEVAVTLLYPEKPLHNTPDLYRILIKEPTSHAQNRVLKHFITQIICESYKFLLVNTKPTLQV